MEKEVTVEAHGSDQGGPAPLQDHGQDMAAHAHAHAGLHHMESSKSREASSYDEYEEEIGEKPSRFEVWGWYIYEFCSYFVQTILIPVVFPLLISQLQQLPIDGTLQEWDKNHQGMDCAQKEILL